MKCPNCGTSVACAKGMLKDRPSGQCVIDTRAAGDTMVRRRRGCPNCGARWTTYERIEPGSVTMNDNERLEKIGAAILPSLSL